MSAYYNENDPKAAAWLRELIAAGEIAHGEVDERSILDVAPDDLRGFTQCHFFAGIGVWSYALRRAGWPDDRPIWTGSCPCQPFSASGKRGGFADERHLWPAWHHLIRECRPSIVVGEQVASKDGLAWLDLVSSDLEGEGYAVGAGDLCAAGVGPKFIKTQLGRRLVGEALFAAANEADPARESVWRELADYLSGLVFGAPHIRQRLYFVGMADTHNARSQGRSVGRDGAGKRVVGPCGVVGGLADATGQDTRPERQQRGGEHGLQSEGDGSGWLADSEHSLGGQVCLAGEDGHYGANNGRAEAHGVFGTRRAVIGSDPHESGWHDPDWQLCRDRKWRPVEPGLEPLVDGSPARVGRLRGYGNALHAGTAQTFIEEVMALL